MRPRHTLVRTPRPPIQVSRGPTFRSGGWTVLALGALLLFVIAAGLSA